MGGKLVSTKAMRREAKNTETRSMVMKLHLEASVPLLIQDIAKSGGLTNERIEKAKEYAWDIAGGGDILMYKSNKKGESAKMMSKLVEGLAIMAFFPGGVTFLDLHFEFVAQQEAHNEH